MSPYAKFLDVAFLKSLKKKPAWFGLGFIQLKLDHNRRLHFWSPGLSTRVNPHELHDHRYSFTSTVLAGTIEHDVYTFHPHPEGTHQLCEVFCQPEKAAPPKPLEYGHITPQGSYFLCKGSKYTFPQGKFHKGASSLAVTYLERQDPQVEVAHIIRPRQEENNWVCPFDGQLTQKEVWAEISKIINHTQC